MIELKDIQGKVIYTTEINNGAKRKFQLMKEDYITLPFSLENPVDFGLGCYVEIDGGIFEVTTIQKPTLNNSTGGYDYQLRLDAYYWKWKNKIFKFTPEVGGQEASWSLTASLDVHLDVFLRNLKALGYTYRGSEFEFSIDATVENKAVVLTYENTSMIDALSAMAEAFQCEWWVNDNVIHFGRCEYGTPVDFDIGNNVVEMTRSESQSSYATRLYVFGSTRNIPSNYRQTEESLVVNGVVQRRLMLPIGITCIDAYEGMSEEEAIEEVVILDDIYPKTDGKVSSVTTYDDTVENEDGTENTETFYRFTDNGITFSSDYILEGEELKAKFTSGSLNGMEFGIAFNPNGAAEKNEDGSWNPDAQLFEIVANEDYGRKLPDSTLHPKVGDSYILIGWDSSKIADLGLVSKAEQELYQEGLKISAKRKIDPSTYGCKMFSDYMFGLDGNGNQDESLRKTFEVGDRVNLINGAYFESGRQSRIIGYEYNLDYPYDSPIYQVGETASYSRLGALESKLESLTFKGQTYSGGNGSGVYVIGTNDTTKPTNRNVFSALKSQKEFLSKTKDDRTPYKLNVGDKLTAEKGIQIGKSFASGLTGSGGFIDEQANAELESLIIRRFLEVPELRFNRVQVTLGDKWNAPGAGVIERVVPDSATTGTVFLKLEEGEYGAIAVGDICMGIFHSEDSSMNATDDNEVYGTTDDGKACLSGFQFAGFYTCYFTITSITGKNNGQFTYQLRPTNSSWNIQYHPSESMHFVCYGSFTDKNRQTSAYTTRTYTRLLHKQNDWNITFNNIAMQYGDLSNMNYYGMDMDGYSIFTNNIYNKGIIKQIKDNGEEVLTANDKGNWVSGTKYDYYDRVSHNGSLWLCVNTDGTNTEPKKGNSDWLLQVAAGDSLVVGGRFSSSKTPYAPNSTIDFASKVWSSTDAVDYAPYGIWTDKDGNRFQFNDGGFCLVDEEVRSGWTIFVDLSNFKDGEDGKSIIVQYSADGSNWHDTFQEGDVFMRQKLGEDGAWSDKMRIVGEAGAAGENGEYTDFEFAVNGSMDEPPTSGWQDAPPSVGVGRYLWMRKRVVHGDGTAENWSIPVRLTGDKGDSTFKSTVFIRTNSKPSVPTGGSYESPIPTSSPKWSDGIPSGEEILWASTRTFALGEVEGEPWSEPSQMTDTADFDVDWSSVETNVGNPTTHPQNWSNVATESTIWMATRTKKNGVWSDWQVSKVKGEKGDSVEFVGRFKTGMIIPSLGVVAMGGSNWVAKKSTSNPPLWTWTDNSGNRFIFSDGGYALTGNENEEEYELMVANGKDGKDGTDYEYIFINTTTDTQPATPSTVQRDDYIPNGWHDDPLGVTEGIPYEWVSQRKKKDGLWGAYSTPSVWAKFGEDGTNWEFVYQRTKTESAPSTPSTKQEDDYIPSGWTDDPKGVSDEYPFEWMSKRRKKGSAWGEYTKPALWSSYSILSYKSTVFIRTNDTPSTPTGGSFDSPIPTSTPKWYDGIPSGEQTLWASTRIFTKNGSGIQQGEWSTPRALTDTASFEAIYHDSEKEPNPPTNYPTTSGAWTPNNGWTDDPTDKSIWMATATKSNGVWGAWQVSKIKGEKGVDGKDGKDGEQGKQGIQGCILRKSEWKEGVEYRNDEEEKSGTRYVDVVLVRNENSTTGWDAYKCIETHTSTHLTKPPHSGFFEPFGLETNAIFTSLIIAKDASIDFVQGNELLIKGSDGVTVEAGLSGSSATGGDVRLWVGGETPDDAPFTVDKYGNVVATNATITGVIKGATIEGALIVGTGAYKAKINPSGDYPSITWGDDSKPYVWMGMNTPTGGYLSGQITLRNILSSSAIISPNAIQLTGDSNFGVEINASGYSSSYMSVTRYVAGSGSYRATLGIDSNNRIRLGASYWPTASSQVNVGEVYSDNGTLKIRRS